MTILGTGEYGTLTGTTVDDFVHLKYKLNDLDYLDITVDIGTHEGGYAIGSATVYRNGLILVDKNDPDYGLGFLRYSGYDLTTPIDDFKLEVTPNCGLKRVKLSIWLDTAAPVTPAWYTLFSKTFGGIDGEGYWENDINDFPGNVDNYVWTEATYSVSPAPNKTEWYAKRYDPLIHGSYGRVTFFGAVDSKPVIFHNGENGHLFDYSTTNFDYTVAAGDPVAAQDVVSIDTKEYYDETGTKSQANTAVVKVFTPLSASSTADEITAYIVGYARNTCFKIERGYMTRTLDPFTGLVTETYDTIVNGFYFITDVELDKVTFELIIEGEDILGRTDGRDVWDLTNMLEMSIGGVLEAELRKGISYLPNFTTSYYPTNLTSLDTVPENDIWKMDGLDNEPQLIVFDDGLDSSIMAVQFEALLPVDKTIYETVPFLTSYVGATWFTDNDGIKKLISSRDIAELDYKINQAHTFGIPSVEAPEAPESPYGVNVWSYPYPNVDASVDSAEHTEIAQSPMSMRGSKFEFFAIPHEAHAEIIVQEYTSGGTWEYLATPSDLMFNSYPDGIYPYKNSARITYLPKNIVDHINLGTTALRLAGRKISPQSINITNEAKTTIDNPLITRDDYAFSLLNWGFPTYDGRGYKWSMRDDPSLRCGNVISLAIDNKYVKVLITEMSRSFNGAGRVECTSVFKEDTAIEVYERYVENATRQWITYGAGTAKILFSWTAVDGEYILSNANVTYRIYDTTNPNAYVFLGATDQFTTSFEYDMNFDGTKTFGISVQHNNIEYPVVPFSAPPFDNSKVNIRFMGQNEFVLNSYSNMQAGATNEQKDYRYAGEWMFYAGQDRMY